MSQPCSTDNLTFAEAMALDPGEVEVWIGSKFESVAGAGSAPFAFWRHASFRHARPRRSRVQEMAGNSASLARDYELIIRAVCDYVIGPCNNVIGVDIARDISRHFLEPR